MTQRTFPGASPAGLHVAIIMDGSGRWAVARGQPRPAGHRAGVEAVRRVVRAAVGLGIRTLTLYSFSSDNWQRPAPEVRRLMQLFEVYLRAETGTFITAGIRLRVIGRRDRLPTRLREAVQEAEARTAGGQALDLRLAMDYSARDAILRAARRLNTMPQVSREAFSRLLAGLEPTDPPAPDVDLLIRTGGEQRLSDFLLWESAYAELFFTPRMWPEFDASDLEAALKEFYARERRFGRISEATAS